MYRKHNPYVALVGLVLLALVLVLALTGCAAQASAAAETEKRFTIDFVERNRGMDVYIITDTNTGKQYLYCREWDANGFAGGGLCLLEE